MRGLGIVLALSALSASACRQGAAPEEKKDMAVYQEAGRLFSCEVPAQWRVLEGQGGAQSVTFLGPPDGPQPFSASISVYHYERAGSDYASPQDYAKRQALGPGKTGALAPLAWKGGEAYEFGASRPEPRMDRPKELRVRQERTVLVPMKAGFLALVYSAPEETFSGAAPVFQAVLDSLHPAP